MLKNDFVRYCAKHLFRCLADSDYRTYTRLKNKFARVKRYIPGDIKIGNLSVSYPDAASFLFMWKEMFFDRIYQFNASSNAPLILDLGANIGLSVLAFKSQYPNSKIIAYEADPEIFRYLEDNVKRNSATDVSLRNEAVWSHECLLSFVGDHSDGGHVVEQSSLSTIPVKASSFKELLLEFPKIDFLKIDIEGAEKEIFKDIQPESLSHIDHIFLEYHHRFGEKPYLAEIISLLEKNGFSLIIQSLNSFSNPYCIVPENGEFCMQLNIYGIRNLERKDKNG